MPMPHWTLSKKKQDLTEEQVQSIQAEIMEKLRLLREEVIQMQNDANVVHQAVNEHRALMIAQENVISSLETRVKELSRTQKSSLRVRLTRLLSVNAAVTGLLGSNYS